MDYKSGFAPIFAGEEVVAGVGVDIGAGFLDTIRAFLKNVLVLGGISAVLTVAVGMGLARSLTRPIHRLVRAARAIGEGDLKRPVGTASGDELGYLARAMEEMRCRILARDAQLRQMLSGVAHEIRNPLGGIELYSGLIADDLSESDPRKAHIRKVIGEVQTLNRVINEFLDYARPGRAVPERAALSQLAREAFFLLAPEMERAGVRYKTEAPEGIDAYVDPDQLKRVIVNLVKNGLQAMPEGGELSLRVERDHPWVTIEVADTGTGMSPEVLDRLFEPFFTTRETGSGLGLPPGGNRGALQLR